MHLPLDVNKIWKYRGQNIKRNGVILTQSKDDQKQRKAFNPKRRVDFHFSN